MPARQAGSALRRPLWSVLVIVLVLGTILVAPTWETLFAAAVAVLLNTIGRLDWRVEFGLRAMPWRHALVTIAAGVALFLLVKLVLQPLCDLITHSVRNLHSFDRIRGRPRDAVLLVLKTMLLAGLCEEIIFRGTVQQRLRMLFGGGRGAAVLSVVLAALIFTAFHWYQGPGTRVRAGSCWSRSSACSTAPFTR